MNIIAKDILKFINETYEANSSNLKLRARGVSKPIARTQEYLQSFSGNNAETLLSTDEIIKLISRLIPLPDEMKDNFTTSSTGITLAALLKALLEKTETKLATELEPIAEEYLMLVNDSLQNVSYITFDKYLEINSWISLYEAGMLTQETRAIIRSYPTTGLELIILIEHYKKGTLSEYKPYINVFKEDAAIETRWLAFTLASIDDFSNNTNVVVSAEAPAVHVNPNIKSDAAIESKEPESEPESINEKDSPVKETRMMSVWKPGLYFNAKSIYVCFQPIAGDIKPILEKLKKANISTENIIFMPIHVSKSIRLHYKIKSENIPDALKHQATDFPAKNYHNIINFLQHAHLLTLKRAIDILDLKNSDRLGNKAFTTLLETIPQEHQTEETWKALCQTFQQKNPLDALHIYLNTLILEYKVFDEYEMADDWFTISKENNWSQDADIKRDIIRQLTQADIVASVADATPNRKSLHTYMLLWQIDHETANRARNLFDILKFLQAGVNLTEHHFNFLLEYNSDFLLRNRVLNSFLNSLWEKHIVSPSIWAALLRYSEPKPNQKRDLAIFYTGVAHLTRFFNVMQSLGFLGSFSCLTTLENDEWILKEKVITMVESYWFRDVMKHVPPQGLTQEIWNALLRCAHYDTSIDQQTAIILRITPLLETTVNDINWGSVHVPSLHGSVGNALRLLDKRYNVNDKDIATAMDEIKKFKLILKFICNNHSNPFNVNDFIDPVFYTNEDGTEWKTKNREEGIEVKRKIAKFTPIIAEIIRSFNENTYEFKYLGEEKWNPTAKLDAAVRCLTRLTLLDFPEQETKFPVQKVIALVWIAVFDKNVHILKEESQGQKNSRMLDSFINNLFEMEDREDFQTRVKKKGNPACGSGSINDLLNSLDKNHPDVTLLMLDKSDIVLIIDTEINQLITTLVPPQKDDTFAEYIDSENNNIFLIKMKTVEQRAQTEIVKRLREANFTKAQIDDKNSKMNKEIRQHLDTEVASYTQNNCLRLRTLIQHQYRQRYHVVSTINNIQKDDFAKVADAVIAARSAVLHLQNSPIAALSALATSMDKLLINTFLNLLAEKNYITLVVWLNNKNEQGISNIGRLQKDRFGGLLRQYFASFEGKPADEKPFGCDDLANLASCIETDGNQKAELMPNVI